MEECHAILFEYACGCRATREIAEFRETIDVMEHPVYFEALDGSKPGFLHPLDVNLPASRAT